MQALRPDLSGLAGIPPGPELATTLAAVRPAEVDDFDLVEIIAATERLTSWAAAVQVAACAELARRAVFDGSRLAPARLAGMELSARLRLAPSTGEHRVIVAQTLTETLPTTLAALGSGQIDYRRAMVLAEGVHGLSGDQATQVEAETLPRAGGRSLGRHRAAVERAVLAIDPRAAEQRHADVVTQRRIDYQPQPGGMGSVVAFLPADGMATLRAALDSAAAGMATADLSDVRTTDQRRVDALVELARLSLTTGRLAGSPDGPRLATSQRRRPLIQVTVPYASLIGITDQPAELTGYGPIPASIARRIAADGTWRRLLTDPATGALLDYGTTRYSPPPDLVDYVVARDRWCVFPGCGQPAHRCQLDHTKAYPDGPTSSTNLAPLSGPHHNAKTDGKWRLEQPQPGRFRWHSPTGHMYDTEPEPLGPITEPSLVPDRGTDPGARETGADGYDGRRPARSSPRPAGGRPGDPAGACG